MLLVKFLKALVVVAAEMAQQLGVLAAGTEDSGLVLHTHRTAHDSP